MSPRKAVVLLSGGLDSAANLALSRARGDQLLATVTVDYGQRAAARELERARKLAEHYDVHPVVLEMKWLGQCGGSALTDSSRALPEPCAHELDHPQGSRITAQAVWVPNRNGALINAAAAVAESLGADTVLVGFNREEAVTFPDNTRSFMEALNAALAFSTSRARAVSVDSYTVDLNKTEIVRALRTLPEPFPKELVWSCYRGDATPCGKCESCGRFARAWSAP